MTAHTVSATTSVATVLAVMVRARWPRQVRRVAGRRGGVSGEGPSSIRLVWPTRVAAMTSDEHENGRGEPSEAGAETGAGEAELAGEEAERGESDQCEHAGGRSSRRSPVRGWPAPRTAAIWLVPVACRMCPALRNSGALGQAVTQHVQQHRGWWRGARRWRRPARAGPCARCWSRRASVCSRAARSAAVAATSREASAITASRVRAKPVPSVDVGDGLDPQDGVERDRRAAPRTSARTPARGLGCARRAARRAAGPGRPWSRIRGSAARPRSG